MKKTLVLAVGIFLVSFFQVQSASAVTLINDVALDTATLARGYSVPSPDGAFSLIVQAGVLSQETHAIVKQLDPDDTNVPKEWKRISEYYEYVLDNGILNEKKNFVVNINLVGAEKNQKRIFLWDLSQNQWKELPTVVRDANNIRTNLSLTEARLVVLEKPIMELGYASWYKYKNCDCAASPDYPKGTKLRVKNLDNNKEVVVTVNDYGPDRGLFPERVIDLDKVAFKKIGALSRGVLKNILVTLEKQK